MIVEYTMSGTIEFPEGSTFEGPRTIRLPDGDIIKLWTAVELNEVDDLTYGQQADKGIWLTENFIEVKELELDSGPAV